MLQKGHFYLFMLCYSGYTASRCYPSQQGINRDARAALDTYISTSQVTIVGRTLDGAVGAMVIRNNQERVVALILRNTFTSTLDMARSLLHFFKVVYASLLGTRHVATADCGRFRFLEKGCELKRFLHLLLLYMFGVKGLLLLTVHI
ncbi:putative alpha/Beta hydrolase [Helianthus anomalus]